MSTTSSNTSNASRRRSTASKAQDLVFTAGLLLCAGGLVGYDWRLAAVICGGLLVAVSLAARLFVKDNENDA